MHKSREKRTYKKAKMSLIYYLWQLTKFPKDLFFLMPITVFFVNKARWYVTQGIAEVVEIGAMLEQSLWDCLNARLSRHAFENPTE